jgi:hypothetical protein
MVCEHRGVRVKVGVLCEGEGWLPGVESKMFAQVFVIMTR